MQTEGLGGGRHLSGRRVQLQRDLRSGTASSLPAPAGGLCWYPGIYLGQNLSAAPFGGYGVDGCLGRKSQLGETVSDVRLLCCYVSCYVDRGDC